jgi:hypothetical protein
MPDVFELSKVTRVRQRLPKGYSGLTTSRVRQVRSRVRQMGLARFLQGYPGWLRVTRAILMHY